MPKHHLYRHYAADGSLLYIGQSLSAFERFRSHLSNADWADLATVMRVQHFGSKDAVQEAEIRAIREEKPKYNKKFNTLALPVPSSPIRDFIIVASGTKPRPPSLKRGRPPKGDRAMTATERSRAHRARKQHVGDGVALTSLPVPDDVADATAEAIRSGKLDDGLKLVPRLKRMESARTRDVSGWNVAERASYATGWADAIVAARNSRVALMKTDEDVKLVARLKRTARGEWLDLCELAERLMR